MTLEREAARREAADEIEIRDRRIAELEAELERWKPKVFVAPSGDRRVPEADPEVEALRTAVECYRRKAENVEAALADGAEGSHWLQANLPARYLGLNIVNAAAYWIRSLLNESEHQRCRLRETAQILISEVGADGPMDAEDAARRAVETLEKTRAEAEQLRGEVRRLTGRTVEAFVLARLETEMIDASLNPDSHADALRIISELRSSRRDLGGGSNADLKVPFEFEEERPPIDSED